MIPIRQFRRILFLVITISLIPSMPALAQNGKWRVKNRLQTTYEFDSNIRETASNSTSKIEASSVRFLFDSQASRSTLKTRLTVSYQGGLQTYFQNSFENKLINEMAAVGTYKLKRVVLGVRGSGRLKIYLNDVFDYASGSAALFVRLPAIFKFTSEIAISGEGLNYQNFANFNYDGNRLRWALSRRLAKRTVLGFEFSGAEIRYNRSAIDCEAGDLDFQILSGNQRDRNFQARVKLNYTKTFLLNLNYSFLHNTSNSCGYTYNKHQVTILFGFPLPNKIWLRGFGAAQLKSYTEDIPPFFPIDLDTEREESNFFILDLSKDLSPGITGIIRFAYYNNESIIRSQFYRKSLLTLGFDFRF